VTLAKGSGQVLLADINRDGHLDLVTKHLVNRTVSLLLGDGKGHFAPAPKGSLQLSVDPGAITLGDVNNDGWLDLAVNSKASTEERIHVFLGNHTSGFDAAPVVSLPAGVSTENCCYKPRLQFVDINRDGNADLISSNGRRDTLEVLLGNGRGEFPTMRSTALEARRKYYTFEFADVDRDGRLDLVVASSNAPESEAGHVTARRGDGKGGFPDAIGAMLSVLPDPHLEAVGDLNGDQRVDIVLGHGGVSLLTLLLNQGDGTFMPARNSPMDVGMPASAVATADINHDRNMDLIVATVNGAAPFTSKIVVLFGDAHGGFVPAPGSPFPVGPGGYGFTIGDINEDGNPDIVASSFESGVVTILLGR